MSREYLKQLIKAAGLNQSQAAEQLGTSMSNLSYYLRGRHKIPEDFAQRAEPFLKQKAIENARKSLEVAGA